MSAAAINKRDQFPAIGQLYSGRRAYGRRTFSLEKA